MANLPAVIEQGLKVLDLDTSAVNVLLPTQTFGQVLGDYDKVTLEVVRIDADPDNGEVSPIGGKLALGRVPLEKIGSAVGIIWDPDRTTILESSETKSRAKATGALRKPNGEWIVLSEEKTVDLLAFEEEQSLGIEEKCEKGNPEKVAKWGKTKEGKSYPEAFAPWTSESEKATVMDRMIRKAMLQFRKFKDERAMTGAKERCIRALLAIKSIYTKEELSKPFVFPRVTLDSSKMLASPEMRAAAVERMTGAAGSIFGRPKREEPPMRDVTPAKAAMPAPAEEAAAPPADDDFGEPPAEPEQPPFAASAAPEDPRAPLRKQLAAIIANKGLRDRLSRWPSKAGGQTALDVISALLDDEDAPIERLQLWVAKCAAVVAGKGKI